MLVAAAPEWVERARFWSTQAREPGAEYHHTELGYNYRLSNVLAGIGRGQLEVLDERVRAAARGRVPLPRRVRRPARPRAHAAGAVRRSTRTGSPASSWTRDGVRRVARRPPRARSAAADIEARPLWKPMHLQPLYAACERYGGEVAADLFERGLCLPSSSSLAPEEQDRVDRRGPGVARRGGARAARGARRRRRRRGRARGAAGVAQRRAAWTGEERGCTHGWSAVRAGTASGSCSRTHPGAHGAVVGVIGQGYVGLAARARLPRGGLPGARLRRRREEGRGALAGASRYIQHIGPERVARAVGERRVRGRPTDFDRLAECDAILICVPTPLGAAPRAGQLVHPRDRRGRSRSGSAPGQLVVLESTTYPGTTDEEVLPDPRDERASTRPADFFLAFSPEREDPGNARTSTRRPSPRSSAA